jgi:Ca-activated chloride channel homolog
MTNRCATIFTAVCLAVLSFSSGNAAQTTGRKPQPQAPKTSPAPGKASSDDTFQLDVDVQIVQIPVSVTNKDGVLIDNLSQASFQVYEDKVQQVIKAFKHEDIPLSVGLVIDNSGSMRLQSKRSRVNSAALSFVRESNPDDETFIVDFNEEAYLLQDYTQSMASLVESLSDIDPHGGTAMNDAIYLAVDHLRQGKRDKKALLVITDGEDMDSKYGINPLLEHIKQSKDITIYTIGLLDENDDRGGLFSDSPSKKAKKDLLKLSELTGGEAFFPKTVNEVADICQRIARELRNQYTLIYSPSNVKRDGTWRTVDVRVTPSPGASKPNVKFRQGYSAPSS